MTPASILARAKDGSDSVSDVLRETAEHLNWANSQGRPKLELNPKEASDLIDALRECADRMDRAAQDVAICEFCPIWSG